ncbi:MAG TPA: arylamine N-acetyltransferase [Steroidobacteraceae bacterium]|nr:arylamine N-acetyltransferase [Steroidobacteraceae bacterium]
MELNAYLSRIGFNAPIRPDLATLRAVHRAHQLAIPFENLDVQLGRSIGLDVRAAYEKIVERRRGGWCFEMNGIFGWALKQIGFHVTRMTAGVMRERLGDVQLGNHLCLMVRLDEPYLADVGFGGSMIDPLPLRATQRVDTPYFISLNKADDHWRFSEHTGGDPFSFDFRAQPGNEALMTEKCEYLQTDPASSFVQNLVVQRRTVDTHVSLRGRVLCVTSSNREEKFLLNSADELVTALHERFDLDVPEAATLWATICARHDALFSAHAAG